jgi:hypothetical protein
MPRTKKPTTEIITEETTEVSVKELWDVLNFSRNMINGMYPGLLSPDLLNARMKENSFTPTNLSEENLNKALSDPKNSEESLRSIVEYLEILSSPFRRIIDYMQSQLALDLTFTVSNVEESSEYKGKPFKKDQKFVFDWLDRFDYQYHLRNVIRQLLRNEIYACCIRDEGEKIVLQELPLQYVKIVSKWDYGYLIAFNFVYFLQPGIDIRLFPKFFAEKFNELFDGNKGIHQYNPTLDIESRGNSQFNYWVDLPPQYGWLFKLDPSIVAAVPHYASLAPEFINQSKIRAMQKSIYTSAASKMLVAQVPMLKDTKAKIADMIAIDSKTLGQFMGLFKSALGDTVKVSAAPLEQITPISFESDNILYDEYLRTGVASSGVNSALIYSSKLKANAIESQLSFQSDSLLLEQSLYPQFNALFNYLVNSNREKKKYKYLFEFEGNAYYLDRQQRFDYCMDLADKGIVLPQKIAAARGMKPQTLIRMMEESKATGFTDLLTPILSSFQMSGKEGGAGGNGGRPTKSDSKISEEGAETKSQGGNIGRGGKE